MISRGAVQGVAPRRDPSHTARRGALACAFPVDACDCAGLV